MTRLPSRLALLAVAASCWGGAWLVRAGIAFGPLGEHARALLIGACVGSLLAFAGAFAQRLRAVALCAAGLLVGAASALLLHASVHAPPLDAWIADRATAQIVGTVVAQPRSVRSAFGGPAEREVLVTSSRMEARGRAVAAVVPVAVRFADGPALVPGMEVLARGRLSSPRPLGEAAAAFRATSVAVVAAPGPVHRTAAALRAGLQSAVAPLAPDAGSLVAGLSIGDESGQPPELADAMRSSGLSHLTAVSGGNTAIVAGAVLVMCAVLRVPLLGRTVLVLGALAAFTVLVGPQPSVLRAVAMGAVASVGSLSGGRGPGPSVLAAAVIGLVVVSPWLSTSWGFALSTTATAGLVLLAPRIDRALARAPALGRLPAAMREALALTLAAQAATLPVLIAMGGTAGWASVPANLLALPAVAPVTILGLVAAAVSPVVPALAGALAWCAGWPAGWIASVASACADLPGPWVPWPEGVAGAVLALAAAALGAVLWRRMRPHLAPQAGSWLLAALVIAGLVLTVRPMSRHGWPPPGWLMLMCDVGQGDAVLLRAGPGAAVLVDAGPDPQTVDRCLADAGIDALPAVVLTHFHADHVDGLSGALDGREIGIVLTSILREPDAQARDVDRVLRAEGITAQEVRAGDRRQVGDVSWEALWPRRVISSGSVPNNASTVLVASVRGRTFLLAGDIESEAQVAVASDLRRFRFDAVKVPHHGSAHVSPLLPSWAPAPAALVSVGADNDYGHPDAATLDGWRSAGSLVVRTDEAGDIAIVEEPGGSLGLATHAP